MMSSSNAITSWWWPWAFVLSRCMWPWQLPLDSDSCELLIFWHSIMGNTLVNLCTSDIKCMPGIIDWQGTPSVYTLKTEHSSQLFPWLIHLFSVVLATILQQCSDFIYMIIFHTHLNKLEIRPPLPGTMQGVSWRLQQPLVTQTKPKRCDCFIDCY